MINQDLFEQFWHAGMRKINKKKARSLFDRVIKKQEQQELFTQYLVTDIQKRLDLCQFGFSSMHPTTYLNQERWNDDYPVKHEQCNKLSTIEQSTQINRSNYERTLREIAELEALSNNARAVGSFNA